MGGGSGSRRQRRRGKEGRAAVARREWGERWPAAVSYGGGGARKRLCEGDERCTERNRELQPRWWLGARRPRAAARQKKGEGL
ncbi:proteasome-associated protein ecm29 [Sesbania bispinosa]|nr:proteasome-associated protein ecm29 [Sesbania bispinosa]